MTERRCWRDGQGDKLNGAQGTNQPKSLRDAGVCFNPHLNCHPTFHSCILQPGSPRKTRPFLRPSPLALLLLCLNASVSSLKNSEDRPSSSPSPCPTRPGRRANRSAPGMCAPRIWDRASPGRPPFGWTISGGGRGVDQPHTRASP